MSWKSIDEKNRLHLLVFFIIVWVVALACGVGGAFLLQSELAIGIVLLAFAILLCCAPFATVLLFLCTTTRDQLDKR